MLYLLGAICCSVTVAVIITYAHRKNLPTFSLFATNYVIAAAASLVSCGASLRIFSVPEELGFSMILGVLFIGCFWLLMKTIEKLGMVIPVTLMRLSAVIPTAGSILLYAELPTAMQMGGILLAFVALPLASPKPLTRASLRPLIEGGFGWGMLLFVSFGITEFLFKFQKEMLPIDNPSEMLMVVFGTAMVIGVAAALRMRERISLHLLATGAALGVVNMYSAKFFILALRELPGMVIFPANGIGVIMLSAVVAVIVWKERLNTRNYIYLACAAIALILIA
jgi:multidrug transporter EmrE-like cation transporter